MTNPATEYFQDVVRLRDIGAPIVPLAWHWWATKNNLVLPTNWVASRVVDQGTAFLGKADFVSTNALARMRSRTASPLVMELLPTASSLRQALFRSEPNNVERVLNALIQTALVGCDEADKLRTSQSPERDGEMPLGPSRFLNVGIVLQDVKKPACILRWPHTQDAFHQNSLHSEGMLH